jgi:hypothetical protein
MLTRITGGEIVDPVNGRIGTGDLWIEDENIVAAPADGRADRTIDVSGCVVMAGAIDIHSHIGGGNVNTARLLLPEHHKASAPRPAETPLSNAGWSTFQTGCLYAKMGFTTVVEPAMSPGSALHTHLELADIPIIDKATLAILGNVDFLLSMIRDNASPQMIEEGEADLHLCIAGSGDPIAAPRKNLPLVVIAPTDKPIPGAAVTLSSGKPGVTHDAVVYSSRVGTLVSKTADKKADLPDAASLLRSIGQELPGGKALPC